MQKYDEIALKERGNALFKVGNFTGAEFLYSTAIERTAMGAAEGDADGERTALLATLHSNRAAARIKLEKHALSLDDTEFSLLLQPNNLKSRFRKGEALMGLHRYHDAQVCFDELNKDGCKEAKPRLLALFDLLSLTNSETSTASQISWSTISCDDDFSGPVEIQNSDGRGRGLFLTRDVFAGEIILVEKAFACAFDDECDTCNGKVDSAATGAGASLKALQKVQSSGLDNARLSCLYDGKAPNLIVPLVSLFSRPRRSQHVTTTKALDVATSAETCSAQSLAPTALSLGYLNSAAILELPRILGMVITNAFATHRSRSDGTHEAGTGLWLVASFINHSKVSNSRYDTHANVMVVRANAPMLAGTEITISYIMAGREASLKNWSIDPSTA